jgi:hypothetical protein
MMFGYRLPRSNGRSPGSEGVDDVPRSGPNLEYLTGIERNIPAFGNVSYAHGRSGAFFRPGKEPSTSCPGCSPSSTFPASPRAWWSNEKDDGPAMFDKVARSMGNVKTLAIGSRLWGETVMNRTVRLPGW